MGAAIDEDQFTEACPAFSTSAVVALRPVTALGWDIGSTEPAPESFRVELDAVLFLQGFSEVAVVVLREQGPTHLEDALVQFDGLGVSWTPTGVAVDDATGSLGTYAGLEPEGLTHRKT